MTFTHALPTNNYGTAKFIVSTSAANGTHTTLASAISSASSGDTIFLRNSVTEDITLKAGVTIAAFNPAVGTAAPTITGKMTATDAGTYSFSGVQVKTNSDYFLSVTGSNAVIVNFYDSYLNCTNNTGIENSNSSSSTTVNLVKCDGDLGTTGIHYWNWTSAGYLSFICCSMKNSGGSSSAGTFTTGTFQALFTDFACRTTFNTSNNASIQNSNINTSSLTGAAVSTAGTGNTTCLSTHMAVGANAAMDISASAFGGVRLCPINCTDTYVFTGSGQLNYSNNSYTNTSAIDPSLTQAFAETGPVVDLGTGGAVIYNTSAGALGSLGTNDINTFEYGTWTPTLDGSTGSPGTLTYSFQLGWYTKINKRVYLTFSIGVATYSGGTGNLLIKGMPYNNTTTSNYHATGSLATDTVTLGTNIQYMLNTNVTNANILINGVVSASGLNVIPVTSLAAGCQIRGEIEIITDS